jgi:toxin ParE1/3/4
MSAPKVRLIISPRARRDYESILLYTLREWGEDQEAIYAAALDRAFVALRDYPQLGRVRDDLRPGYRAYLVEQHVVYYRLTDSAIIVMRILHGRANVRRALFGRR